MCRIPPCIFVIFLTLHTQLNTPEVTRSQSFPPPLPLCLWGLLLHFPNTLWPCLQRRPAELCLTKDWVELRCKLRSHLCPVLTETMSVSITVLSPSTSSSFPDTLGGPLHIHHVGSLLWLDFILTFCGSGVRTQGLICSRQALFQWPLEHF